MIVKNCIRSKERFRVLVDDFKLKRYYGTLWYADVCKYFGISKEEAIDRALSPSRKSLAIWTNKEKIEASEANVINAWKINDDMVIRNCWYREKDTRTGYDKLLKRLDYKERQRILDYGCGVSSFTKWALRHGKFDITLAEIEGPMLDFCKWRYGKRVSYRTIGPGKKGLPLKEKYDIIFCLDVLEHIWNPVDTAKHLCYHLNINGKLIETYIDDSSGSNLTKANKERPLVLNFFSKHLKLISGSMKSQSLRIWLKKDSD